MKGCSNVTIAGNLTRDPELRHTPQGQGVTSFTVAVNGYKDDVAFVGVKAWNRGEKGKLADICANSLKKGKPVIVTGKLKEERWEKDGKQISRLFVVADDVIFLGPKSPDENEEAPEKEKEVEEIF
jgi:single-strand DNA-binding protein